MILDPQAEEDLISSAWILSSVSRFQLCDRLVGSTWSHPGAGTRVALSPSLFLMIRQEMHEKYSSCFRLHEKKPPTIWVIIIIIVYIKSAQHGRRTISRELPQFLKILK